MLTKKKILLAVTKSNWGGAQRYVFDIATNLDGAIYDVSVLCGGKGILAEKLRLSGIRVISLPYLSRDIKIFDEFKGLFDLKKIFKKERPDILHLNSPKIGGLGALAARLSQVPKIIYTVHGWPFFEDRFFISKWLIVFFSWLTIIFSHKIILICKKDLATAIKFPFAGKKMNLIHNGIGPINFFEKFEARKELVGKEVAEKHGDDFWICGGTELIPNKNISDAIKGVTAAKKQGQNIFYCIIGEGEEKDKLIRLIEEEKATDYIRLIGFKKDAAHYLKAFDCFLLTSKKEGLPYVLLEAGLAGLTIVATNVGGIPDIVQNRSSGYLIESTNSENVTEALSKAKNNPTGKELSTAVEQKFSLGPFLERLEGIYN